ncbi:LPXTG cell wall anchor domain-containing protein [Micromonospora sp. MA102]|uniref:LPXTG cell wall anchor domain-containing protein n=1 Tax=Micromonospora sp. MA102 TaxID=2952755 RepID=UPI0021C9CB5D|nr:LPXTG cell wall anchor domain-containing protein [Micromonospora sp. MA102]
MTARFAARLALGASVLAAGVTALPVAGNAAPAPDSATLAAVTERDPATGLNKRYPVKPGEVVPAALGVTNLGDAPVSGLVVQIRVLDDLDLAVKHDNCWYAVDSNLEAAWCEFDSELAAKQTLAIVGDVVTVKADARAGKVTSIVFRWYSRQWVDAQGGVQRLADGDAGQGTSAVRGSGAALTLAERELPLPETPRPINFAYPQLVTPPTTQPTATPMPGGTPSATPTGGSGPTAVPTGTAGALGDGGTGGNGGGLPVTGANIGVMAGVGGALLLLGGGGYLVARRRRTRFVA